MNCAKMIDSKSHLVKYRTMRYRKDGQMMQNDALEQIRKAESDNQTRIQTATEQAADRLRQASGDREVRLREKEAALRRELTDACAETEKKAAAIRSRSISDADTHAREIRASVSGKMDAAVSVIVNEVLSRAAKSS